MSGMMLNKAVRGRSVYEAQFSGLEREKTIVDKSGESGSAGQPGLTGRPVCGSIGELPPIVMRAHRYPRTQATGALDPSRPGGEKNDEVI